MQGQEERKGLMFGCTYKDTQPSLEWFHVLNLNGCKLMYSWQEWWEGYKHCHLSRVVEKDPDFLFSRTCIEVSLFINLRALSKLSKGSLKKGVAPCWGVDYYTKMWLESFWKKEQSLKKAGLSSEVSPQYFSVKCSVPWAKPFSLSQSYTLHIFCTRSTHTIRKENLGLWETLAGDHAWNCLPWKKQRSAKWTLFPFPVLDSEMFLCLMQRCHHHWINDLFSTSSCSPPSAVLRVELQEVKNKNTTTRTIAE